MLSGSILITSGDLSALQDGLEWKRDSGNFSLVSVIQYMMEKFNLGRNRIARKAMIIHQDVGTRHELTRNKDGRYSISHEEAVITRWSNITITPNYIVVDKKGSKVFVKEVITNISGSVDSINYLQLDTQKMSEDTIGHWTCHFDDRDGRVQSGSFFGDGIEQDAVFGKELKKSKTKAVGLITKFFGNPSKVRISSEGGVMAYGNIEEEQFLKYIEAEVLPYRIQLSVK